MYLGLPQRIMLLRWKRHHQSSSSIRNSDHTEVAVYVGTLEKVTLTVDRGYIQQKGSTKNNSDILDQMRE